MKTQKEQACRRQDIMNISQKSTMAPINSLGMFVIMIAISSASALTNPRPIVRFPGTLLSDSTNSNVHYTRVTLARPFETASTQLPYSQCDDAEDDHRRNEHLSAVDGLRTRLSGWWATMIQPVIVPVGDEAEQRKVDDYLEFLDKRYHRLHDVKESRVVLKPAKAFPVWDWLMDTSDRESSYDAKQSQDDALFVLGVAELASTRLLQKHHIPVEAVLSQPAIDTVAYTVPVKSTTRSGLFGPAPTLVSSSIVDQMRARRRSLIVFQEKQLKRLIAFSVMLVVNAPSKLTHMTKAIWNHGGGKKTIALSLSMLTACFFLLRPVVNGVAGILFESGFAES